MSIDRYYSDAKVFRCSGRGDSFEARTQYSGEGIVIGLDSYDAPDLSAALTDEQARALGLWLLARTGATEAEREAEREATPPACVPQSILNERVRLGVQRQMPSLHADQQDALVASVVDALGTPPDHDPSASASNEQWLDGYRWALTHLNEPGVINDAATYLAAGVNDTAVLTRTTATAAPFVSDESKGADSPSAPAPAVSTTPPAPAVDDEPGVGAVVRDCEGNYWTHAEPNWWHRGNQISPASAVNWTLLLHTFGPLTLDKPAPPAPEPREDAVEALARALHAWDVEGGPCEGPWGALTDEQRDVWRSGARTLLAALDRGAVPGYGPTGDRAGEVSDDERHVLSILRDRESTYRQDVLDALPHNLARALQATP